MQSVSQRLKIVESVNAETGWFVTNDSKPLFWLGLLSVVNISTVFVELFYNRKWDPRLMNSFQVLEDERSLKDANRLKNYKKNPIEISFQFQDPLRKLLYETEMPFHNRRIDIVILQSIWKYG